jgi:hypothetical protein
MNTKEMIEVMQAFEDGKKIEVRERGKNEWMPADQPSWNWRHMEYRIAPDLKKEDRWERVEVELTGDKHYMLRCDDQKNVLVSLPNASRYHGFGGIDYQSPFNPKVIVRSMVPLMFEETGGWATFDFAKHYRPGIPVAAWFWQEGER